jgi:flagellar biosynthesis/type III secretory pathway protein FliH
MKRLFLVPVLGLAALALSGSAHAQSVGWLGNDRPAYADGDRQSFYDASRTAYDNGYREGLKQGEKDGRKNNPAVYQDERTFQRADKGYHREFGPLERYRQSFRTGYASGYNDAYERYAPSYGYGNGGYGNGGYGNGRAVPRRDPRGVPTYPDRNPYPGYPQQYPGQSGGYGGYNSAAVQNGSSDGYEKGVEDARKNRPFDPVRQSWYRAGDRHYDGRFGSREQYKDVYRQAFKDGYERGYREGRYR